MRRENRRWQLDEVLCIADAYIIWQDTLVCNVKNGYVEENYVLDIVTAPQEEKLQLGNVQEGLRNAENDEDEAVPPM